MRCEQDPQFPFLVHALPSSELVMTGTAVELVCSRAGLHAQGLVGTDSFRGGRGAGAEQARRLAVCPRARARMVWIVADVRPGPVQCMSVSVSVCVCTCVCMLVCVLLCVCDPPTRRQRLGLRSKELFQIAAPAVRPLRACLEERPRRPSFAHAGMHVSD